VLVLGDLHIPYRAPDLSAKFKKLLVPGKVQHIIGTGNMGDRDVYEYLQLIAPDVHCVKGDCDVGALSKVAASWPNAKVLTLGSFKIGVIHGHQVVPNTPEMLALHARQMDADILISGNTHVLESFEYDGKFFINPGSATGAFKGDLKQATPSFVLMDVQESAVVVYVYKLVEDEVKVDKLEFVKQS